MPFQSCFIGTRDAVKALVMQGGRRPQIVFTVIFTVRRKTINRKVFTDQA